LSSGLPVVKGDAKAFLLPLRAGPPSMEHVPSSTQIERERERETGLGKTQHT
jgi:hypothetical protein